MVASLVACVGDTPRLCILNTAGVEKCLELRELRTAEERRLGVFADGGASTGRGYLFVFPVSGEVCMSGVNLSAPLDIAFADDEQHIFEQTTLGVGENLCRQDTRFVIEAKLGSLPAASVRFRRLES